MLTNLSTLDDRAFAERLSADDDTIHIVIFTLPWSGGSQLLKGIVSQLAEEYRTNERVAFSEMNADQSPRTRSRYRIGFIPTTLVFRGTELVHQIKGVVGKYTFSQLLQPLLHTGNTVSAPADKRPLKRSGR